MLAAHRRPRRRRRAQLARRRADRRRASARSRRGGRFVEIGKRGIKSAAVGRGARPRAALLTSSTGARPAQREPALIGGMLARLVDDAAPTARCRRCRATSSRSTRRRAPSASWRRRGTPARSSCATARRTAPRVRRDGTYLVTGGLSGLGLVLARWLAEQGAGRLVLVGRRGVTPEAAPLLDELRAQRHDGRRRGARRRRRAGAVARCWRDCAHDGPPLRGVVHGAGVLDDAGAAAAGRGRVARRSSRRRCTARALLDALTRADPLDFFVLFSSVAALLGSAGQANHAAANAFLDALAHERAARGLPGAEHQLGRLDRGRRGRRSRRRASASRRRAWAPCHPAQGLQALRAAARRRTRAGRRCCRSTGRALRRSAPAAARARVPRASWPGASAAPPRRRRPRDAAPSAESACAAGRAAPAARRARCVDAFVRERALRALGLDAAARRSIRGRRSASSGSTRCWRWSCATRSATAARPSRCRRRCCSTTRRSTR